MSDPLEGIQEDRFRHQLEWLRSHYGGVISSAKLRKELRGFKIQGGIYKPEGAQHALWVRQTLKGRYPDQTPVVNPDGSWTYRYTPEWREGKPDMNLATNKALLRCAEDTVPVGVLRQRSGGPGGAEYEVLGLAYVAGFDGTHFLLQGEPIRFDAGVKTESGPFRPFDEDVQMSEVLRRMRDRRFAVAVRFAYRELCAACMIGFRVGGRAVGLEAGHIIPVSDRGTLSDVRNGILLCRNHHTLFDNYAWTLDEDRRVVVTRDKAFRQSATKNHILACESKRLPNLPGREDLWPAVDAIKYRLDQFERHWG